MCVKPLYDRSNSLYGIQQDPDIIYIWKIFDRHRLICHNSRYNDAQRRIFCTADQYFSL
jgi:hypothetical protein